MSGILDLFTSAPSLSIRLMVSWLF